MPERVIENAAAALKLTLDNRPRSSGVLPPLAVVLGFLGCSERVARSLSRSLHVATGYDTAWTVPPTEVTFSPTSAPKIAFARALADALCGESDACPALGKGGIVLVSFSNSGVYVVQALHELLTAPHASASYENLLGQVAGMVFDSGPCSFCNPLLGAEALLAGRKERTLPEYSFALARSCIFSLSNILRTGSASGALLAQMQSVKFPRAAELFVYSRDDPLCDSRALEEFLREREMRARDSPRLKLRFDKSSHCGHLRLHFKEYAESFAALHSLSVEPWRRDARLQPWGIPPTAKL